MSNAHKTIGVKIEAEDQWGATYAQDYVYREDMTDADRANYRVWALGQFINGIASNGNYINSEGRLVFTFRMPVFDTLTMSELFAHDVSKGE